MIKKPKNKINNLDQNFNFEILTGGDVFHQIRQEWNELWNLSLDISQYQSWDWQYLYWKNLTPRAKPIFIVVRDLDGQCVCLGTFCIIRDSQTIYPKMVFLGDKLPDYQMFFCKPGVPVEVGLRILDHLFNNYTSSVSYLELSNIPEKSWTGEVLVAYLQNHSSSSDHFLHWKTKICTISLPDDLDQFIKHLGPRSRRDYKYDQRRLQRDFAVNWRIFENIEDIEICMSAVEAIDKARWKLDSIYCDSSKRAFYYSLAKAQTISKIFLTFVLYLNEKPAAYVSGAVVRNSYKVDRIGFDPDIAPNLSIGKTTNFYAIEACIQKGLSEYDLTRGDEAYKKRLGGITHDNLHARLYRSQIDRQLVEVNAKAYNFLRNQTWLRRLYQRFYRR